MPFDIRDTRNQGRRLAGELARLAPSVSDGHDDLVAVTIANGLPYPTAVGVWYWLRPQTIAGPETAGTTPTLAAEASATPIVAFCLGPNPPGLGRPFLVSTSPEGRWVFHA